MTTVVFVAPYAMETTNRFLRATVELEGAKVAIVSSDPIDRFPERIQAAAAAHWRLDDCLDLDQLAIGVGRLSEHFGGVDVLTGILENLQVPLGQVRDQLGIPGMSAAIAENFRDKARMKSVFEEHGIPCARSARVESADAARSIIESWAQPVVVKPLAGMGAQNTFRIDNAPTLEQWLDAQPPSAAQPALIEEFLSGREFSFESVLIDGEMVWHSIGRYEPTPLTVLENPWIQWSVILPRSIDDQQYDDIRRIGVDAVRCLGLTTGLSHMEWFLRPDGTIAVSEVGARPPGAQIASLMSWVHDTDLYRAWAERSLFGRFDLPERKLAVGAAYLRAQGAGSLVSAVTGIDHLSDRTRSMVVESHIPEVGSPPASTYEGEGFVIVRDADTGAVEEAVNEIVSTIRVERR